MVRKLNSSSRTAIAAFVAAAFGVTAGAAFAQTTTSHNSRDEAAANNPAAREITLTNRQNEHTLQYSRARNLRVCNLTGQSPSLSSRVNAAETRAPEDLVDPATRAAPPPPAPIPLALSYQGQNERVQPGNCFDFRASTVRLSLGRSLPAGGELDVSILPLSANGFVNGRTVALSSQDSGSARQSVTELKEELKRDDEEERQANAELSRARAHLAQTTRDLKQAEAQERHVASVERHTAQAARDEQQNAQQPSESQRGTPQ